MVVFHVNMQSFSVIDLYYVCHGYIVLYFMEVQFIYIYLVYLQFLVIVNIMYVILSYIPLENLHIEEIFFGSKHMHILYWDDSSVAPTVLDKLHIPYHGVQGLHLSLYFISCLAPTLTIYPWVIFEPPNCVSVINLISHL